jgi:anti-sigma regulatory factor (Ser/Thr protein kinase)
MCRPVDLNIRSMCETILMLLPHHEDAKVEVLLAVAPDVPQTLLLDETYIHRILMNLLSNSLKFTTSGYVMLSIEIQDNNFIAKVRDSGIGIPSTFMPRLFDSFTQAKTRGSQRGTGLGLNIVKKLVDKMGGIIQVESRHEAEPSGTTFTIEIPVGISRPQQRKSGMSIDIPTVVLLHRTEGRTLEGLKIAWELSGFRVIVVDSHRSLSNEGFKYICVDAEFLEGNAECLRYLVDHQEWSVLVPYTERAVLQRLQGLMSTPHMVPISKPLVWHTLKEKVANASMALSTNNSVSGTNHASSALANLLNDHRDNQDPGKSLPNTIFQVLLVEDNLVSFIHSTFSTGSLAYSVPDQSKTWQENAHVSGLFGAGRRRWRRWHPAGSET